MSVRIHDQLAQEIINALPNGSPIATLLHEQILAPEHEEDIFQRIEKILLHPQAQGILGGDRLDALRKALFTPREIAKLDTAIRGIFCVNCGAAIPDDASATSHGGNVFCTGCIRPVFYACDCGRYHEVAKGFGNMSRRVTKACLRCTGAEPYATLPARPDPRAWVYPEGMGPRQMPVPPRVQVNEADPFTPAPENLNPVPPPYFDDAATVPPRQPDFRLRDPRLNVANALRDIEEVMREVPEYDLDGPTILHGLAELPPNERTAYIGNIEDDTAQVYVRGADGVIRLRDGRPELPTQRHTPPRG